MPNAALRSLALRCTQGFYALTQWYILEILQFGFSHSDIMVHIGDITGLGNLAICTVVSWVIQAFDIPKQLEYDFCIGIANV